MPTVLQKLSLNAFRGVSGLVLENLTPVSLVVGANNSGKSSILEAAGLLLRPPEPTQWIAAVRHRDADMSLVDGLWSLFPGSQGVSADDLLQESAPLLLEAQIGGAMRRVRASCTVSAWGEDASPEDTVTHVDVSVDNDPSISLRFPGTAVAHQVPLYRVFTVTPATHYSTKALVEHLSRVVDEGKKQLAVELLQLFDANVNDLDVVASLSREAVRVTHRTRGVVDLASFGDGMRRSAALALALTRASQGVLLIDEIEAGIHHSVLRPVLAKLLAAAATSQVQLIATTHSLEAVDAIVGSVEDRGTPDALSAFWVQRQDGKHEVRGYDFAKLCMLREGGLDIR
jgi:energy-coupling factor transporter ATP-binding protein EcfA2